MKKEKTFKWECRRRERGREEEAFKAEAQHPKIKALESKLNPENSQEPNMTGALGK